MRTHYSSQITPQHDGREVVVAGWVHEIRDLGSLVFLILRDRDGLLQVTLRKGCASNDLFGQVRSLSRESVVRVFGRVKREERAPREVEVIPSKIELLNPSDSPLPLDPTEKVKAGLDTRLDARFMDLRRAEVQKIFWVKAEVMHIMRDFFRKNGFLEVNTPKILASATEGGAALFPISYFDREAFLAQSPQLYKQMMMATGVDRVFEISHIFRAEEHDTTKHLNEVISVDVEVAFATHDDVMRILEELIQEVYSSLSRSDVASKFGIELEPPDIPFERVRYEDAVEMAGIKWGEDLSTSAEKVLGEKIGEHYFIVDWPTELKPFYVQPYEDDPKICKAFDLMHPRLELASGAQRIHSYEQLRRSLELKGLSPQNFSFYLEAFRYGMPPHAGWGLGLERLLMTILNLDNIREAMLFPRDRRRLVP